jgi:hypothetical protein
MGVLAIVDDRDALRQTIKRQIQRSARKRISVIDSRPLDSRKEYPSWIADEDIVGLIIDERLGEQRGAGQRHVSYAGHQVVDTVRAAYPTLPIFVLTSYPKDPGLQARFGKVEDIFDRRVFTQRPAEHVDRLVRAAVHYSDERDAALARLSNLSAKIAGGTASKGDRQKAKSLQVQLDLPVAIQSLVTREQWLRNAEKELTKLKAVRRSLQGAVRKK